MPVSVYIPTPFRRLTGNRTHVSAAGATVGDVLNDLQSQFPGMGSLIFDEHRQIPAHVNVYVTTAKSIRSPARPRRWWMATRSR
jgi:molybdopterin synthase sulfur carrier subunit